MANTEQLMFVVKFIAPKSIRLRSFKLVRNIIKINMDADLKNPSRAEPSSNWIAGCQFLGTPKRISYGIPMRFPFCRTQNLPSVAVCLSGSNPICKLGKTPCTCFYDISECSDHTEILTLPVDNR
jgi:hypothetical protein